MNIAYLQRAAEAPLPAGITEIALPDDEPDMEEALHPVVHGRKWPESLLLAMTTVCRWKAWGSSASGLSKPCANEHESE